MSLRNIPTTESVKESRERKIARQTHKRLHEAREKSASRGQAEIVRLQNLLKELQRRMDFLRESLTTDYKYPSNQYPLVNNLPKARDDDIAALERNANEMSVRLLFAQNLFVTLQRGVRERSPYYKRLVGALGIIDDLIQEYKNYDAAELTLDGLDNNGYPMTLLDFKIRLPLFIASKLEATSEKILEGISEKIKSQVKRKEKKAEENLLQKVNFLIEKYAAGNKEIAGLDDNGQKVTLAALRNKLVGDKDKPEINNQYYGSVNIKTLSELINRMGVELKIDSLIAKYGADAEKHSVYDLRLGTVPAIKISDLKGKLSKFNDNTIDVFSECLERAGKELEKLKKEKEQEREREERRKREEVYNKIESIIAKHDAGNYSIQNTQLDVNLVTLADLRDKVSTFSPENIKILSSILDEVEKAFQQVKIEKAQAEAAAKQLQVLEQIKRVAPAIATEIALLLDPNTTNPFFTEDNKGITDYCNAVDEEYNFFAENKKGILLNAGGFYRKSEFNEISNFLNSTAAYGDKELVINAVIENANKLRYGHLDKFLKTYRESLTDPERDRAKIDSYNKIMLAAIKRDLIIRVAALKEMGERGIFKSGHLQELTDLSTEINTTTKSFGDIFTKIIETNNLIRGKFTGKPNFFGQGSQSANQLERILREAIDQINKLDVRVNELDLGQDLRLRHIANSKYILNPEIGNISRIDTYLNGQAPTEEQTSTSTPSTTPKL